MSTLSPAVAISSSRNFSYIQSVKQKENCMKTKVRQSEATMCSEWGLVAHLSRIFFISSHLVSQRCRPKTDFGRSFAYEY
jgi:hypothetical protein